VSGLAKGAGSQSPAASAAEFAPYLSLNVWHVLRNLSLATANPLDLQPSCQPPTLPF